MDKLFDRISRILATPMPRSQAFRLIAAGLTAAVMAPFASAKDPCPADRVCAGVGNGDNKDCCPSGQQCCAGSQGNFCCSHAHTCCGDVCCVPPKICDSNNVCRKRTPSDPQP